MIILLAPPLKFVDQFGGARTAFERAQGTPAPTSEMETGFISHMQPWATAQPEGARVR